jgi:antitoxin component HigA of HigAB toxin-antitoxin module
MNFNKLKEITSPAEYEAVKVRLNELIKEATEKGLLEPDADNKYTREIGHLSYLGAIYESAYMDFKHIKVKKSPLIRDIEDEMYNRNMKQKELAAILKINEPTLSQIMQGKRRISMNIAKRLYKNLHIKPERLLEYA